MENYSDECLISWVKDFTKEQSRQDAAAFEITFAI